MMIAGLLLGSLLLMILGPFTVFEHYIFGIFALLLMFLINLPRKFSYPIVIIVCILWITKFQFKPAAISTNDRIACVQKVCAQLPQPIYVVTNSGSHDHQGLGYAYLAQQINCNMFTVTQWKDQLPVTMAVMNENTTYDPQGTDFYELNRFEAKKYLTEVDCGPHLGVTVFSK